MSKSSEEAPAQEGGAQKDGSIYENRAGTKKIIRVITVMAYVFSVSFAAILLSAYYVFLWVPPNPRTIQRHPLTGDPQAEYLSNNLLKNLNVKEFSSPDDQVEDENLSKNYDLFKKIMSREGGEEAEERINRPQKLVAFPQNLLAYDEFFKLREKNVETREDYEETPSTPIFFNTQVTKSTKASEDNEIGSGDGFSSVGVTTTENTRVEESGDAKADDPSSLANEYRKFLPWKDLRSVVKSKDLINVTLPIQIIDNGTKITPTSASPKVLSGTTSTGDLKTTTYENIDNYSYIEFNNDVTIGDYGTTDATTSQKPLVIQELENYEMISRNSDTTLSQDSEIDDSTTQNPDQVQIYPAAKSARDILNRK